MRLRRKFTGLEFRKTYSMFAASSPQTSLRSLRASLASVALAKEAVQTLLFDPDYDRVKS
jgi:hypothetical protein